MHVVSVRHTASAFASGPVYGSLSPESHEAASKQSRALHVSYVIAQSHALAATPRGSLLSLDLIVFGLCTPCRDRL
jgi:hypothetical protein